jgi:hypothetical protein
MARAISIIYDGLLGFLWFRLLLSQASGDFSDPRHPSPRPWYLTRTCPTDTASACYIAQASLVISGLAALFYGGRFVSACIEEAVVWIKLKKSGSQCLSMKSSSGDEEDGLCPECAAATEKERYRHVYGEALSPVLAFFPDDMR